MSKTHGLIAILRLGPLTKLPDPDDVLASLTAMRDEFVRIFPKGYVAAPPIFTPFPGNLMIYREATGEAS